MQRLEVSGAVRPIYGSLGVKRLSFNVRYAECFGKFQHVMQPLRDDVLSEPKHGTFSTLWSGS